MRLPIDIRHSNKTLERSVDPHSDTDLMRSLKGLLVNDASLLGHHGSALVTAQARRLCARAGIALDTGYSWPQIEALLDGPHDFDIVIVNGEGSIHHNSKTAHRTARLAVKLADRGVPAFLINASEEANDAVIYEGLARFRKLYVRDCASKRSLAKAGIDSCVVPDLTLTWDAATARRSGPLLVSDAADSNMCDLLFEYARRTGGKSITLRTAPPVPTGASSSFRRASFEVKRMGARLLPRSPWSLRYSGAIRDFDVFVAMLANASGIVSGRFHAVCIALRMELPFLAVSAPTPKIESLLGEIGLTDRLIGAERLRPPHPGVEIAPFSIAELDIIRSFIRQAEVDATAMFNEISSYVRAHKA